MSTIIKIPKPQIIQLYPGVPAGVIVCNDHFVKWDLGQPQLLF